MPIKAVISEDFLPKLWDEPERIKTVDITNCIVAIQTLYIMAKEVKKNPNSYDDMSNAMAQMIIDISKGIRKE